MNKLNIPNKVYSIGKLFNQIITVSIGLSLIFWEKSVIII